MKYLLILCIIMVGLSGATSQKLDIAFFGKYENGTVKLRWLPKDKNLHYSYKIYKKEGSQEKLLTTVKRMGAKEAEAFLPKEYSGVGEFLFPLTYAKSKKEKMQIISQSDQIVNFQLLMADQNILFARVLGLGYIDKNIHTEKQYSYTLKVYDRHNQILAQKSVNIDPKNSSMEPVLDVHVKGIDAGVGIRWKYFNQYGSYNIYRSEKIRGEYIKLNEQPVVISYKVNRDGVVEAPPYYFIDDTAKEGKTYFYKVSGIDIFGSESPKSLVEMATRPKKIVKPLEMPKPILKVEENKITVDWKPVKGAKYYDIYRSYRYEKGYKKINKKPLHSRHFVDKNLLEKISYFYIIKAVNNKRVIALSTPALGVPWDNTPPTSPKNLHAKTAAGKVMLSWEKVKDKSLLGYKVYRSFDPKGEKWHMLQGTLVTRENITDILPVKQNKDYYYYKVVALDHNQNISKPSKIIKVKLPDVTAPRRTAIIGHKLQKDCVVLKWRASTSKDTQGYFIYKKSGNKTTKVNGKPVSKLSYKVCKLEPMKKYYFAIAAIDKNSNLSQKTDWLLVQYRDKKAPLVKSFKIKTLKDATVEISFQSKDQDIDGFRIFRSEDGKFFEAYTPYIKGKKSFIDKKRKQKKHYFYYIKVYDKSGNVTTTEIKKQ